MGRRNSGNCVFLNWNKADELFRQYLRNNIGEHVGGFVDMDGDHDLMGYTNGITEKDADKCIEIERLFIKERNVDRGGLARTAVYEPKRNDLYFGKRACASILGDMIGVKAEWSTVNDSGIYLISNSPKNNYSGYWSINDNDDYWDYDDWDDDDESE